MNRSKILWIGLLASLAVGTWQPAVYGQESVTRNPDALAAFNQGMEQLQQENFKDAIALFSQAVEVDNTFAAAYVGLGEALLKLEDYEAAIQRYSEALNYDQNIALAYNGRGECHQEMGNIELAINDFNSAFELDRNDPRIAANLGDVLINYVRDAKRAIQALTTAIDGDPENAEAYRNRGMAHAQLKELDEAIADVGKSIELDGENYESHMTLASIYLFEEDLPMAVEAVSRAIEVYQPKESSDPDVYVNGYLTLADARLNIAKDLVDDRDAQNAMYEQVIADTEAVLEEYPDRYPETGFALYRRGLAQRMLGQFGDAVKSLTDAIQIVPPGEVSTYMGSAFFRRGICWHNQGQGSLARGDFEEAAGIDYEDPLPFMWIGFTYSQEEEYRQAIDQFSEAIARKPNLTIAYVNRGLAYFQLEEFNKAVENFNEAIRSDPANAEHYYMRGKAHRIMQEDEKAKDSFYLATLNDEQSALYRREMAATLRTLGEDEEADSYDSQARELESTQQ